MYACIQVQNVYLREIRACHEFFPFPEMELHLKDTNMFKAIDLVRSQTLSQTYVTETHTSTIAFLPDIMSQLFSSVLSHGFQLLQFLLASSL